MRDGPHPSALPPSAHQRRASRMMGRCGRWHPPVHGRTRLGCCCVHLLRHGVPNDAPGRRGHHRPGRLPPRHGRELASTLGRPFDRAPWEFIEAGNFPAGSALEVVGGWPSPGVAVGEAAGDTPSSAISVIEPAPHDASHAAGVSLPWTSNSASPFVSLPPSSRL